MSFKNLDIKMSYESGIDDMVEGFYTPVLSEAVRYDRIAGFFSSSCLAVVARGMSSFFVNGGRMRLITSPILNSSDADIIRKFAKEPQSLTAKDLGLDLDNIQDEFVTNHVKALGWLLSQKLLDIKLAVVYNSLGQISTIEEQSEEGLFHQKVGILYDKEGNVLTFSGSINETAAAWVNNDEEFKVFRSWNETSAYCEGDIHKFDDIWNNKRQNTQTFALPEAVCEKLIQYSADFDKDSISIENYKKEKKQSFSFLDPSISLFEYQKAALLKWKRNDCRMLFEMATGTGKTRTAIGGIKYLMNINKRLFVIISTPQGTLSKQWAEEVAKLNVIPNMSAIIDGTNSQWKADLKTMLLRNAVGMADICVIYTTHNTASSNVFGEILSKNLSSKTKVLFVGDEAHWLGAKHFRNALNDNYDYRIGLSATPSRWFDDSGTKILVDYFGKCSYEFTLKDALTKVNPLTNKHFLVDYYYNISKVSLTEAEYIDYCAYTERITKLYRMKDSDPEIAERVERLIEQRADIVKNAENKFQEFSRIIDNLQAKGELEDLIVFVSPQQMQRVQEILLNKRIFFHKLTEEEGTREMDIYGGLTERQFIIQKFKSRDYQLLIAIKCLDEGIDIPSARRGILMSSSTNPREYVQRIGRVIRQATNKPFAYLFDICVDSAQGLTGDELEVEKKIRKKEITRLKEISECAINSAEALQFIYCIQ